MDRTELPFFAHLGGCWNSSYYSESKIFSLCLQTMAVKTFNDEDKMTNKHNAYDLEQQIKSGGVTGIMRHAHGTTAKFLGSLLILAREGGTDVDVLSNSS